ncbi:hypothetical protein CEN45_12600 [Fischerella thermalis CCMEE 5198]|jgi:hypothetical protein|uniref:hypothetical protein n=1 Tax=Fischerella thermalis TaxID=372787 RepID=UPI000C7F8A76|nr:hypothetical protein [Fischerella thermalis]PLZ88746.1 hypothetical protein CI594_20155 [Fischerella thermalis CCMEE 5196]PMB22392.1 hypothetical protein CEN45_12600 [Fischerella thermalis CCMEE 5198]
MRIKYLSAFIIYFFVSLLFLSFVSSAEASVCRNYQEHQICIIDIKRSAKNYWEYRAVVSVDGVKRPLEVYNCRDQNKVEEDGNIMPFDDVDPGKLICRYFQKQK